MKKGFVCIVLLLSCWFNSYAQEDSQKKFREFQDKMRVIEQEECGYIDYIWGKEKHTDAQKDSVNQKLIKLRERKVAFAQKSIDENRNDEHFLWVLDIYIRNFLTTDEFEAELKKFTPEVQATKRCQKFFEEIKYSRLTVPGQKCIDFEMVDHNGKKFKFSDVYKKNKLTLIDFWASWCGACRGMMPHVKEVYNTYKDKGFGVVSYSIDDKKENWEKAYKEENLPWPDGSNLQGKDDVLITKYAIRGIPCKILVDRKGIIIGRRFNEAGSLEAAIEEYLKSSK